MFYVLLTANGTVDRYPCTLTDLKRANPGTSFAKTISDETAATFNCFPVVPTSQPSDDYTVNLTRTAVQQGNQWVEEWVSTPATPEEITERTDNQATAVRAERNQKLADCDWTQLPDSPLDADGKLAWGLYRETLRMIPQQTGFPWNIQWPTQPNN